MDELLKEVYSLHHRIDDFIERMQLEPSGREQAGFVEDMVEELHRQAALLNQYSMEWLQ